MNRAQLKSMAKEQIKGKVGILFLILLVNCLVAGIASGINGTKRTKK